MPDQQQPGTHEDKFPHLEMAQVTVASRLPSGLQLDESAETLLLRSDGLWLHGSSDVVLAPFGEPAEPHYPREALLPHWEESQPAQPASPSTPTEHHSHQPVPVRFLIRAGTNPHPHQREEVIPKRRLCWGSAADGPTTRGVGAWVVLSLYHVPVSSPPLPGGMEILPR